MLRFYEKKEQTFDDEVVGAATAPSATPTPSTKEEKLSASSQS
jgi:hypothetical protein